MHQKLSGEHKNFHFFSQKRKCATARLKLESWNYWAPNSWLWQTAIERKEGMTTTVTSSLQLTWLSSNDAYKTSLVKIARRVGVWGGVLTRWFLSFFCSCNSSWRSSATKEWTSEPTNKDFLQQTLFTARKHARTRLAGGGGRSRPVPAYAGDD
jgi:hypothetical protein